MLMANKRRWSDTKDAQNTQDSAHKALVKRRKQEQTDRD